MAQSNKEKTLQTTQTPTGDSHSTQNITNENSKNNNAYTPSEDDLQNQILAQLKSWQDEFLSEIPQNRQDILFNLMCQRLYWRLICYMRKYPQRLVSSEQTYSDRCIGREEIIAIVSQKHSDNHNAFCAQWLDAHQIPDLTLAQFQLKMTDLNIRALLQLKQAPTPIAHLRDQFLLSDVELEILATMAIIMTVDNLHRLMIVAWADYSVRLPTVQFLSQLIADDTADESAVLAAFEQNNALRQMHLIQLLPTAAYADFTPLIYAQVAIEQPVINAFRGKFGNDLPQEAALIRDHLSSRTLFLAPEIRDELTYALKSPNARLTLIGPKHAGRRTILCALAHKAKFNGVLEVDMINAFAAANVQNFEKKLSDIMRDAQLEGCLLLLRFDGLDAKPDLLDYLARSQSILAPRIAKFPGAIAIASEKLYPALNDAFGKPVCIHILPPTEENAERIWLRALEPWTQKNDALRMAEMFSRNYILPTGSIFAVVRDAADAHQSTADNHPLQSHHILNEIRKSFRHQLDNLAEITVSDVPLSGVVLPDDAKTQVNEILQYAKQLSTVLDKWGFRQKSPYGNALSVLFAGPPGTGKTLLACALANELGKVLYRVDLSRIVDKYIGETEKNLAKIFDEAAKAQAVILFDEADALFAKRTEVKSSNDRYANLESNFLLQKLESYNGITILTTNLSKSIDDAFRRRLRFIIEFPMPDAKSRAELWKRMMPPNAPLSDDIRWSYLAKTFEMSGGYIRNAVLKAAIAAAAENKPIDMDCLSKAAEDEARSMGKLLRIHDDDDEIYYYDEDDPDR